jgi:coniferyl-aldehyde dehydrogenase
LPFDHLLFTGSTAVGRKVMAAAAPNLTPVTLELGGKAPALVAPDFPLDLAAARITSGKWFNAGQTCIGVDYTLVDVARRDAFVEALRTQVRARFGDLSDASNYTRIINTGQFDRLLGYLDDARARGATVVPLVDIDPERMHRERLLPPTLVLDPSDETEVMRHEIFGPILPIRTYARIEEALAYIGTHDRPLALYPFSNDARTVERIVDATLAGGVAVNDTLVHFAVDTLPFGGVGPSGMGAIHGKTGFDTFSKQLPVFHQSRLAATDLLRPPYKGFVDRLVRFLSR